MNTTEFLIAETVLGVEESPKELKLLSNLLPRELFPTLRMGCGHLFLFFLALSADGPSCQSSKGGSDGVGRTCVALVAVPSS